MELKELFYYLILNYAIQSKIIVADARALYRNPTNISFFFLEKPTSVALVKLTTESFLSKNSISPLSYPSASLIGFLNIVLMEPYP